MLNKIKFLGIIFMSILLLTNCNKDNKQDPTKQGEFVLAPMDITPDKDWECDLDLTAVYAVVVIDGDSLYPLTFVLDGKLYTQAIKLDEGAHVLEYFALMDDMGTPDKGDDKIYKATPQADSDYAIYVDLVLPYEFYIVAFQKFELKIWVLCYIEAEYLYFGFFWFEVHEIIIREQCFFGDFCIKDVGYYAGSLYDDPIDGVLIDEIAIFKIKGWRNNISFGEWDNELTYMEGLPFCIQYADRLDEVDLFKFELWIYVKVGLGFDYVLFQTWYFNDDQVIEDLYGIGDDGVMDFVLGNCYYTPPDLALPPWMNLPCGFDYTIVQYPYVPSYFQANLSFVPPGYDFGNGDFDAWCADEDNNISQNATYCMCAYSSLYPWLLPYGWNTQARADQFGRVNFLFNNMAIVMAIPGYNSVEMQHAIWNIFDGASYGGVAEEISDWSIGKEGFIPLPGGFAAIPMFECDYDFDTPPNVQITFRVVDP